MQSSPSFSPHNSKSSSGQSRPMIELRCVSDSAEPHLANRPASLDSRRMQCQPWAKRAAPVAQAYVRVRDVLDGLVKPHHVWQCISCALCSGTCLPIERVEFLCSQTVRTGRIIRLRLFKALPDVVGPGAGRTMHSPSSSNDLAAKYLTPVLRLLEREYPSHHPAAYGFLRSRVCVRLTSGAS